jgi:hypothetical protein
MSTDRARCASRRTAIFSSDGARPHQDPASVGGRSHGHHRVGVRRGLEAAVRHVLYPAGAAAGLRRETTASALRP